MRAPLFSGQKTNKLNHRPIAQCATLIRNAPVRSCPDSNLINKYLLEQTGFEGNFSKISKVCFSCYKCQPQILKETSLSSTDPDLTQLITSLKGKQSVVKSVQGVTDTVIIPHINICGRIIITGGKFAFTYSICFF